jgi:hypothetical protein
MWGFKMFGGRRKLNSLGLRGDGDDVAVLENVERAFGIRILDSEAVQLRTVGQLYDLILVKLPRNCFGPDSCLTASAFYRLRAALTRMGHSGRLRPGTGLSGLIGQGSVRRFWRWLEQESGLRLPGPSVGPLGLTMLLTGLLFFGGGIILAGLKSDSAFLLLWVLSFINVWFALKVLPMTIPAELNSLGELSRDAARENFGTLAEARRTFRADDVWAALDYLLRKETGADQPIDRETVFFDAHHP